VARAWNTGQDECAHGSCPPPPYAGLGSPFKVTLNLSTSCCEEVVGQGLNGSREDRTISSESVVERCRCDWQFLKGLRSRRSIDHMDDELTTRHWIVNATSVLQRVADADRRFSASMAVNNVSVLSAADELQVTTWDATLWTAMHACPDVELGERVGLMLNSYAEVAITAQRAMTVLQTPNRHSAASEISWQWSTSNRKRSTPANAWPDNSSCIDAQAVANKLVDVHLGLITEIGGSNPPLRTRRLFSRWRRRCALRRAQRRDRRQCAGPCRFYRIARRSSGLRPRWRREGPRVVPPP
jgi:hypothetical protein